MGIFIVQTKQHVTQAELFLYCYRWYKFIDGTTRKQPVVLNDRVKQVSGTLIIKEAKVEDSGKYLCVVNNSVGGKFHCYLWVNTMSLLFRALEFLYKI